MTSTRLTLIAFLACICVLTGMLSWAQAPAETPKAAPDAAQLDGLLKEVAQLDYGKDLKPLNQVCEIVEASAKSPKMRQDLAKRLCAVLKTNTTLAAKQFLCIQLSQIASDESVETLVKLLGDEKTMEMARFALERNSSPAAEKALIAALENVHGPALAAFVNSLGQRRAQAAIPKLAALTADPDAAVAAAALTALGKIGAPAAAETLAQARAKVPAALRSCADDAYLLCADKLLREGAPEKAATIYDELRAAAEPKSIQYAATEGLIAAQGEKAVPLILKVLAGDDPKLHAVAAQAARRVPGSSTTAALVAELPKLKPNPQALLLDALADRGDAAALPAVTAAASSDSADVRIAAYAAIGRLGNASSVDLLARAAAAAKDHEGDAPRDSLTRLPGADVDGVIMKAAQGAEPRLKAELIRALAARNAVAAIPMLLEAAHDKDESIRVQSLEALGKLAPEKDVPALVELLVAAQEDPVRNAARLAVVDASGRIPDPAKRAAPALAGLAAAKDVPAKCALLNALGQIGDKAGLPPILAAAKDPNSQLKAAGIDALANWPKADTPNEFLTIAETEADPDVRIAALRGALRMLGVRSDRPPDETVAMYKRAMALATRPDEKKAVIQGLADLGNPAAVAIIQPCLQDNDLKEAAQAAIEKLNKRG